MDPVSALIFASIVTWLWAKNVAQDAAFAVRGQDPPSYRREQQRIKDKTNRRPATERRGARRFWGNAWHDAWETAEARRARAHQKRAEKRRDEWDRRDQADRAWPEADQANRDHDRREAANRPMRCEKCGGEFPASQLTLVADDGKPTWACPSCAQTVRDAYPKAKKSSDQNQDPAAAPRGGGDAPAEPTYEPKRDGDGGGGTVIPFAPRPDQPTNPDEKPAAHQGDPVSGETPNLTAAIAYCEGMANTCNEGVQSTEQSMANCQDGGVSPGPALSDMAAGQEALSVAAGHYQSAANNFRQHLTVKESYDANQDAGDKRFVTQD